jgi:hypothetical protein
MRMTPEMRHIISNLTAEQRWELVAELLASLEEEMPVPQWQLDIVNQRLATLEQPPDSIRSWPEVRADLRAQIKAAKSC